MRRIATLALIALAVASPAMAGHCYGTLFENGQTLRGAQLTLTCGSEVVTATSDGAGAYRMFAQTTGACTLQVAAAGWVASASLNSYDGPAPNDFNVVHQGSTVQLVRR